MKSRNERKQVTLRGEVEQSNSINAIITVTEHLAYLFAVSILILLPLVAIIIKGVEGAVVSGIIIVLTSPITINILRSVKTVSFIRFLQALGQLLRAKFFQLTLITIINLWVVFKVGLQTLIPFYYLLTLFITTIAIGFLLSHFHLKVKDRSRTLLISMGVIPFIINLFLLINFLCCSNPFTERYHFTKNYERTGSRIGQNSLQQTSFIRLEDNKYAEYLGMRTFLDYERMKNATYITYTLQDGFFGVLVVTDYKFE